MSSTIFQGIIFWAIIGIVIFNLYVVFVFRTGLVYTARKPDGTLKERVPASGMAVSVSLLLISIGLLLLFDYFVLVPYASSLTIFHIFLLNFLLYLLIFFYDTYVIDYWVIGKWRPKFMHIPEEMNADSMHLHIVESTKKGPIIISAISLVGTLIAFMIFF